MLSRRIRHRLGVRAVVAAALLLAGTLPGLAQTDVTTSRVSGTVTGGGGGPLPGVTCAARNTETGLTVRAVTDGKGFYRLLNLPTGTYTVSASREGFATLEQPGVRLLLGSAPTIDFSMQPAQVADTITVTDTVPVVEVTNTSASTTIQTEQIEALPVETRNFKSLVLLTPETRGDSDRGDLSISGQRGINTSVTVDGADFTNAFFGGTVGGAEGRAPLAISHESIKEFTVITNGASVEFGRSGGGFVNVVTKSGTNDLRGSLFYYIQPQEAIADFNDGSEPGDQEKEQFGGSLGGRIIPDRLFYFASYDEQRRSETIPINPLVLDADVFARWPALASPPQYVQTQDGDVAFGRLDFQAASGHRLMLRGNFTDYQGINGTSDSQTRTESYNGVEGLDTDAYVAQWSGQLGGSVLNDLNLNSIEESTPRADKGRNLPEVQLGGFRYGEVSALPIDPTVAKRKAFGDTLTYMAGDHVWKGGVEHNDTTVDQVFRGNWRGVFVFNNEADLLAGRWSQYRQFGGLNGLTSTEAGRSSFGQKETALFAQDQWFVRPNLTVTAGVRLESLDQPDEPVLNPDDRNPDGSFRLTREIPDQKLTDQVSPRLGVSWSPVEKAAVRFSAGRFWSRTPAILLAQLYTANGLRGTQYVISNRVVNGVVQAPTDPLAPGWGAAWTPEGVERIDFTRVPFVPRPGVFVIDEDFGNPYTDRVTLGVEYEVVANASLGVDFTYAEGKQLQRLKDSNRVYDGGTAANGLPTYSRTNFPFPFYGRITTSVSDAESEYRAVTGTLKRRLSGNWSAYAAVTWSHDRDNDSNERNFANILVEDFNDLDANWGPSNRDQEWKVVVNGLWRSPFWGLGLAGSLRYATGSPYTATVGSDVNFDGEAFSDRPMVDGRHFGRNSFRQPDFRTFDLRLFKEFGLGPGDVALAVECFNCTDEENRFVTQTVWGSATSPTPTRPGFGVDNGVYETPRTMQFSLRYGF